MPPFEMRPAIPVERAAPVVRALACWPAWLAGTALVLDALQPLPTLSGGFAVLWLDLAAVACLVWALVGPRRARLHEWTTPLDGRVVSGLVLAVLHVVRMHGAPEPVLWLRQITAAGACYYAFGARLRRAPNAPDALWPTFALVLLALSGVAIANVTRGAAALEAACRLVDANWVSRFGLAKTLMLLTLLCAGRASEPGARTLWRVTAVTGALASALCLWVGGAGLGVASLASLDEPFYFATSIVAFTFLASLSRMAWQLSRDRPEEAGRWWGATLMFPLIAALLLFGGTTGGEGVRAVAALAGAAVIATRAAPRAAALRPSLANPQSASEPPAARAA